MPLKNTAIFLSIREKATRLPKKVLLPIQGKTITEHLIDRLKTAKEPERVIMTTSTHPGDEVLVPLAARCGIPCFRGSEEDKLERYLQAARAYGVEFMVIVDGDDPFCDPVYIDRIIKRYRKTQAEFVKVQDLPLGANANGFTREALEKVCRIKRENDTEVWGGYFTQTGLFRMEIVDVTEPRLRRPDVRMTLDYEEDYRFFLEVFRVLYVPGRVFTLREVMDLLHRRPEIIEINRSVQKLYEENLGRHAPISYELNPPKGGESCVS